MKKQATGGKRLQRMLPKIDRGGGLWIDTYNQCVNDIAGTIKARVKTNCMYFVSEDISDEENRQSDDRGERPTSDT